MIKTLFRSHCKSILGYLSHVFHISIGLSANTKTKICIHQLHILLIVEVNLDCYDNYEVNQSPQRKSTKTTYGRSHCCYFVTARHRRQ